MCNLLSCVLFGFVAVFVLPGSDGVSDEPVPILTKEVMDCANDLKLVNYREESYRKTCEIVEPDANVDECIATKEKEDVQLQEIKTRCAPIVSAIAEAQKSAFQKSVDEPIELPKEAVDCVNEMKPFFAQAKSFVQACRKEESEKNPNLAAQELSVQLDKCATTKMQEQPGMLEVKARCAPILSALSDAQQGQVDQLLGTSI